MTSGVQTQKVSHEDERRDRLQASKAQEQVQGRQNILISVSKLKMETLIIINHALMNSAVTMASSTVMFSPLTLPACVSSMSPVFLAYRTRSDKKKMLKQELIN